MTEKKLTRSEQKRQAILEAAHKAFKEYGVQGTSMDQLAALAEVSKRTVYNHFESKEALVMHLIREMWQKAIQGSDVEFSAEGSLEEQLTQLLMAEIEVITTQEYIDLARVAMGHFFYHPEALKQEIERMSEQESALKRWLNSAIESGKLKPVDMEFAINQLHGMVKGSFFWPQLLQIAPLPDQKEKEHLVQETAAMFLSYYQQ